MSFMKKDQHIDPDLFDLFLQSGVYLEYAKKFLAEAQIDEVDIAQYVGPLPGNSAWNLSERQDMPSSSSGH